jgi:hypothetical protein
MIIGMFFLSVNAQTNLKNVTWVLKKIEDKRDETSLLINNNYSILRFSDSTYTGYGCNAFSADQGCTDPEDYKAEDIMMQNFTQLDYLQSGDSLILKKGTRIVFTYLKRKEK